MSGWTHVALSFLLSTCHGSWLGDKVRGVAHRVDEVDVGVSAPLGLALNLRLHLAPRDPEGLADKIANGVVLTPEQYQAQHAPSKEDVQKVMAHLAQHDIKVSGIVGHTLSVVATVDQAQKAFGTDVREVMHPSGRKSRTVTNTPKLPDTLPQVSITGLKTRPTKINHLRRANWPKRGQTKLAALYNPAEIAQQPLFAQTIRRAYNIPKNATGRGQSLAMVELDGYDPKDLDAYAQQMGIRRVPTRNVLIGGADGSISDQGGREEVTMDIQLANALAPGLEEIVVYEAPNSDHALNDIFAALANPPKGQPLIKFISCSWGEPEELLTQAQANAEGVILQQLAAQGQTLFVASGDSGARDDGRHLGTDDPASQPYVVAVGGTTLTLNNGRYGSEQAWSGGGGGISRFWAAPAWQKGLEQKVTRASLTRRDVPDVALNADPTTGYATYIDGWQTVGGTSCAAPLWAAFAALADERRATLGKPPLGFFAPALYQVAQSPARTSALHDVADNSTNGYYPAVVGVDAATGWGSFNGAPLLTALGAL